MKYVRSTGILNYRIVNGQIEVLLGKCGGPKWENIRVGSWGIPKGEIESDESDLERAFIEFEEEIGQKLVSYSTVYDLGESSVSFKDINKVVKIFAVEKSLLPNDEYKINVTSNIVKTEWPEGSGEYIDVPEISEAYYFKISVAKRMIFKYQKVFLDRLEAVVANLNSSDENNRLNNIENEEGECSAGLTTNAVFGSGNTCTNSLVEPVEKKSSDPGMTTSDIASLYVPGSEHKKRKRPVFKRINKYEY